MIVTEKEAAQLWCPFARVALGGPWGFTTPVTANRDPRGGMLATSNCIGSQCMLWTKLPAVGTASPGELDNPQGKCSASQDQY